MDGSGSNYPLCFKINLIMENNYDYILAAD